MTIVTLRYIHCDTTTQLDNCDGCDTSKYCDNSVTSRTHCDNRDELIVCDTSTCRIYSTSMTSVTAVTIVATFRILFDQTVSLVLV